MNPSQYNFVAVDIAKANMDVRTTSEHHKVSNHDIALKKLLLKIQELPNPFVVCEATGGYERKLMALMHEHQIPIARVNPTRIRAFAKSEGIKAKTDPIDSKMILQFAQQKQLRATAAPEHHRQRIHELMDRRAHLTEQLTREKNRIQNCPDSIIASIKRISKVLDNEIKKIETQIRKTIEQNEVLKGLSDTISSVVGVGEITTWTLLAYLHELGHLKRNQIVALAGLAPYNRDSGEFVGKRYIQGGRAKVRKCLYMAAKSAAQHNPIIKEYVSNLILRGKAYRCALVAAMRKILIHLHILVKKYNFSLAT